MELSVGTRTVSVWTSVGALSIGGLPPPTQEAGSLARLGNGRGNGPTTILRQVGCEHHNTIPRFRPGDSGSTLINLLIGLFSTRARGDSGLSELRNQRSQMPSDTSGVGGERPARLQVRLLGAVEIILDGRRLRAFNSLRLPRFLALIALRRAL